MDFVKLTGLFFGIRTLITPSKRGYVSNMEDLMAFITDDLARFDADNSSLEKVLNMKKQAEKTKEGVSMTSSDTGLSVPLPSSPRSRVEINRGSTCQMGEGKHGKKWVDFYEGLRKM